MSGPDSSPAVPKDISLAPEKLPRIMERICGLVLTGKYTKMVGEADNETQVPQVLLVGWSTAGLPMMTTQIKEVSPTARIALNRHNEGTVQPREFGIKLDHVLEFSAVSEQPADFRTRLSHTPQDLIEIKGRDERGDEVTACFTHLALLDGISQAVGSYFEDSQHPVLDERGRRMAGRMFSLFLPHRDSNKSISANGLIFKPKINESTNESAFRDFMIDVMSKVIEADRKRPVEEQRGFVEALGQFSREREQLPGLLVKVHGAFRQGPAEDQRRELQNAVQTSRNFRAGAERVMQTLGLRQQTDPQYYERLRDPYSHPNLEVLSLEDLGELASQMCEAGGKFYAAQEKGPL